MQSLSTIVNRESLPVPDFHLDRFQGRILDGMHLEFFFSRCRFLITPNLRPLVMGEASRDELSQLDTVLQERQALLAQLKRGLIRSLALHSALLEANSYFIAVNEHLLVARFVGWEDAFEVKLYTLRPQDLPERYADKIYLGRDLLRLDAARRPHFGLAFLRDSGFFGRMLSVRGEFGYWVFEGDWQEAQRPSWNYRSEDGGGIILDMVCHWRYVLDNLFGEVESVSCLGTTDIPERFDEKGRKYQATADDSAYATFRLKGGVIAHINMSWVTRVYRDDLVTFQVDGTLGSAVAGLSDCVIQPRQATPRPVWNPDEKRLHDFYADWQKLPDNVVYDNGFKEQWEMFIRHVCEGAPYKYTLLEGAKGVQLAECALQSWKERRWIDVAPIKV